MTGLRPEATIILMTLPLPRGGLGGVAFIHVFQKETFVIPPHPNLLPPGEKEPLIPPLPGWERAGGEGAPCSLPYYKFWEEVLIFWNA
jgi:hypothetical protein